MTDTAAHRAAEIEMSQMLLLLLSGGCREGKVSHYGGERSADAIVAYMKKRTGPPCTELHSKADVSSQELVLSRAATYLDKSVNSLRLVYVSVEPVDLFYINK